MQRRQRRRSTFLPSGPLPHAEAGASPDLETLGVPSLLCTRVSFELCAYIGEHADHELTTALDQTEDRRLVLLQCAPSRRTRQPAASARPPLFATAAGWPLCPATT